MKTSIGELLKKYYLPKYNDDTTAVKKLFQEIVICSLSRLGFFEYFAINGNGALRLYNGLDYDSDELSFVMTTPVEQFDFIKYVAMLEKEMASYGLKFDIYVNQKATTPSHNEYILYVYVEDSFVDLYDIAISDKIRVDLAIDLGIPENAITENVYNLLPAPYEINILNMESLFAYNVFSLVDGYEKSQIDAKSLYEYYFFVSKETDICGKYLRELMVKAGYLSKDDNLGKYDIRGTLGKLFDSIDIDSVVDLIEPYTISFDKNKWNSGLFLVSSGMLEIKQ